MIIKKELARPFAVALIVLGLSGCAGYQATSLKRLSPEFAPHAHSYQGIAFSARPFTKKDCQRYLDRDVIKAGYQPVQITVENNSGRTLIFSPDSINLPCVDAAVVASKVHTSTMGRALAWGIPGLFFLWPLLIPAAVDSVGSSEANAELDRDFAGKGLQEAVINPGSTLNGVVFIPVSEYRDNFSVTLVDRDTREKIIFSL